MRRQYQPVSPETSIDPVTHSGRGTRRERRFDNGLTTENQDVVSIRRGETIDRAPRFETRDDLISPSFAVVEARSGNDSSQMDEADEDSDLSFGQINDDISQPAISAPSTKMWLAAAAAVGLLLFLKRR